MSQCHSIPISLSVLLRLTCEVGPQLQVPRGAIVGHAQDKLGTGGHAKVEGRGRGVGKLDFVAGAVAPLGGGWGGEGAGTWMQG